MNAYAAGEGPVPLVGIACTVCRHDIPASAAVVVEAADYVHFCGLDCYDRWRNQAAR